MFVRATVCLIMGLMMVLSLLGEWGVMVCSKQPIGHLQPDAVCKPDHDHTGPSKTQLILTTEQFSLTFVE